MRASVLAILVAAALVTYPNTATAQEYSDLVDMLELLVEDAGQPKFGHWLPYLAAHPDIWQTFAAWASLIERAELSPDSQAIYISMAKAYLRRMGGGPGPGEVPILPPQWDECRDEIAGLRSSRIDRSASASRQRAQTARRRWRECVERLIRQSE